MKEKKKTIWGKYELKPESTFQFAAGEQTVSLKRLPNGWMFYNEKKEELIDELRFSFDQPFQSNGNESIFQTGRSDIFYFAPALPSKPVVLRNNKSIKISPHHSIKFYLAVPLNIQFYYSQLDEEHFMTEFALKSLSDTWFGETDSGEPAFAIGNRSSLFSEKLEVQPYEILCPVKINNQSHHQLELERLLIRVENLAIYIKNGQLISNQLHIDFKGTDQVSNLHFSTDKTIHGENPQQVAKARGLTTKTILGKSFHFIKNFTQ